MASFVTETTPISAVTMLRFNADDPLSPVPPFVIDYSGYVERLSHWLVTLQRRSKPPYTVCVINGFVKTGKTTALMCVLPALIRQHQPMAKICTIDFSEISVVSLTYFFRDLHEKTLRWAQDEGLHVKKSPRVFTYEHEWYFEYISLLDSIARQATVFFLWDEVQKWFKLPEAILSDIYPRFKSIVSSSTRPNQYFAFTGSGMVTAWNAFCKIPANGHSLAVLSWRVSLPHNSDAAVTQLCYEELKKAYPGLPAPVFHGSSRSPAGMCYTVATYAQFSVAPPQLPPNESALPVFDESQFLEIQSKYHNEFSEDMLPLMERWMNNDTRLSLLQLAYGVYLEDPANSGLFGALYDFYFKPFLVEYRRGQAPGSMYWDWFHHNLPEPERTFGFPFNEFSQMISTCIARDGTLLKHTISSDLIIPFHQHRLLLGLARAGEIAAQGIRTPTTDLYSSLNAASATVFETYHLEITFSKYADRDWFTFFLDHHSNEKLRRWLIDHAFDEMYTDWYCDLLRLIRNVVYHMPDDGGASLRAAVKHVPPCALVWLQALKPLLPGQLDLYA